MREASVWLGFLLGAANALAATTSGTVTTLDGTPLAGASVRAYAPESQHQERRRMFAGDDRLPLASVTSDQAGSFVLPVPGDLVLQVVVELDGYAPWVEEVFSGGELGAVLLREAPRVRGHVGVEGRPLAGAWVVWHDDQGRPLWVAETDDRGRYQVPDPERWASSVTVLHPRVGVFELSPGLGRLTLHEPWHASRDRLPLRLEPSPGRSMAGRVVADDRPVAGAEVEAAGWPLARSDGEGRFTVRVPEAEVPLQARAGGRRGWAVAGPDDGEVTIALGDPRSLRVTVEDERGRGLAGAGMRIFGGAEEPFGGRYVADRDGRIEVDGLPAAELAFWVEVPDHRIEKAFQQIDLRQRREAEVRLVARPTARVRGRIVDAGGRPIAGALVFPVGDRRVLYGVPDGLSRVARSHEDGRFELALPLDQGETASLLVLARGSAARAVELPAAPRDPVEPVEVRLPAGVEAMFSVTDAEGEPLPEVTVAIVEGGPRGVSPEALVVQGGVAWFYRTDPAGQARVRLRLGLHHLAFHIEGFAPFGVPRYDARAGAEPETIVLRPGAEIEGRVVTTSGRPAGEIVVQAQGESIEARTRTDDDGHFRLEELAAGPYIVTAAVFEGIAPAPITVEAPARGVTLRFDDGVELSGYVFDRSTRLPVAAAMVSAEVVGTNDTGSGARPARTDDAGRFTLRGLRAGRIVLRLAAEGFLKRTSEEIEIDPSEPTPPIEIDLEPGLTLSGRVTDDRGEPLAEVQVKARGPSSRRGSTDPSGEYVLGGVAPGTVEVTFKSRDFLDRQEVVELAAPGGRLDVELERGQILSGVVRDLEGKAVEGAGIRGSRRGRSGSKWSRSDDRGGFELRGLAPGQWQLTVSKSGFAEAELSRVVPSRSALEVILEPAATGIVAGTVRGADRDQLATLTVRVRGQDLSAETEVEEDGTYRIEEAPAGDVKVQLSIIGTGSGEKSLTRRAVVPRGGRARVDFDLEDAPRIRGRVVRGEDPVLAAQVQFERIGGDEEAEARTDAGGWFEVEIGEGNYQVTVSTVGGSRHRERMEIVDTSILEIDVAAARLEGRVVDGMTGEGLAGAAVELRPARRDEESSYSLPEVTADSRGRFAILGAPIGRFLLLAHAAEFAPRLVEVELEGGVGKSLEIVLELAEGLDVVLFDARSGVPLQGTVVVREPSDAVIWDGDAPRSGDGVRLPLGPGDYKVSVSASGYASQTLPARVPSREPLRVGLTPGGTVVVRSQTLARRVAKLIAPDGEEYVRCWCNKISAFRIEGSETVLETIAPGSYTFTVYDPDGESQEIPIQVFEGLSVEVAVR